MLSLSRKNWTLDDVTENSKSCVQHHATAYLLVHVPIGETDCCKQAVNPTSQPESLADQLSGVAPEQEQHTVTATGLPSLPLACAVGSSNLALNTRLCAPAPSSDSKCR